MGHIELGRIICSIGLGVLFALSAYRLRVLDRRGSVAGGVLAATVVFAGLAWAVPSFAFLALSSALSKLGRRRKANAAARAEKGDVRDAGQVVANGGVGWALLVAHLVSPVPAFYAAFLGAFAAAAADTWATEIGTLAGGAPRHILTGRRVATGTSGAVSALGTAAAALGATVVWAAALPWAPALLSLPGILAVVGGGLVGAFADSLLGATMQVQYRAPDGALTERRGPTDAPYERARGWPGWDNDRVNLAATVVGAAVAAVVFVLTA